MLSFSPDGKTIAVVSGSCNVCFWDPGLDDENGEPKVYGWVLSPTEGS